ncbi:MAG TPA: carboxypeptidase-like regulatory domain-containing protein, partial [Gemmatimonadaceae bacterium]|nr:carboxypeptidase-like regulatory domain-containing protein [Gemmatimonadaceae bacterium]
MVKAGRVSLGLIVYRAIQSLDSMQLRSIVLTAAFLAAGTRAGAQDVRVEVVEAATGKPIIGANVVLLDSAAVYSLGGGFSDQNGRTDLRASARGKYRVRADKPGYETWMSVQLLL